MTLGAQKKKINLEHDSSLSLLVSKSEMEKECEVEVLKKKVFSEHTEAQQKIYLSNVKHPLYHP